jgi:hypothetical protein
MSRFYKRQETLSESKPHGFEAVIPKLIAASNVCAGLAFLGDPSPKNYPNDDAYRGEDKVEEEHFSH